jgi:hypothetical protein
MFNSSCSKGQIKSEWIYEVIDFPTQTQKFEGFLFKVYLKVNQKVVRFEYIW